jgi:hypothetical protein
MAMATTISFSKKNLLQTQTKLSIPEVEIVTQLLR